MSDFRELNSKMMVSPQITPSDIAEAKDRGVTLIVNNRPDGEDLEAPQGDEIEAAAREAGLDYVAIPIGRAGFSEPQIDSLSDAIDHTQGRVLGYCRSGTRSTLLWALARAKAGDDPEEIARSARAAGYDVAPVRSLMDVLAAR